MDIRQAHGHEYVIGPVLPSSAIKGHSPSPWEGLRHNELAVHVRYFATEKDYQPLLIDA